MAKPLTNSCQRSVRATRSRVAMLTTMPGQEIERDQEAGAQDEPQQRGRQEHLPAEAHQLIVAVARQRRPSPKEDEKDKTDFQDEPERPRDQGEGEEVEWWQPAAEEQNGGDPAHQDHVGVLAE